VGRESDKETNAHESEKVKERQSKVKATKRKSKEREHSGKDTLRSRHSVRSEWDTVGGDRRREAKGDRSEKRNAFLRKPALSRHLVGSESANEKEEPHVIGSKKAGDSLAEKQTELEELDSGLGPITKEAFVEHGKGVAQRHF
jgi:hypothetical protein